MNETVKRESVAGGRSLLRAFAHRNFRLFFLGQGISLIGTWMQQLAMTWLVYRFSNSAFLLGVVGFSGQIPVFFLSPVVGVLVDRLNRHRLLLLTQTLAMLQAFLLAYLTLAGLVEVWAVIVLSVFLGTVNAFDITTRQVFMKEMLEDPDDLANAIALNSSLVNGARLVGPALAGVVITLVGEGVCFLLNGVSYLAVLAALLAMRLPVPPPRPARAPLLRELASGFAYAFGFPPIRSLLLLLALTSLMGAPFTVLMPVFVTKSLHGEAGTLGVLMAAFGVGALTGAVYLASRTTVLGLGPRITLACASLGLSLIAFSFTDNLWLALGVAYAAGLSMMVQMTASNTVLQTIVEDDKRGRVMSLYTMALMGVMPLGSLLAGSVAGYYGTLVTLRLGGVGCLAGAVWFAVKLPALRRLVRPLYALKGILPMPETPLPGVDAAVVDPVVIPDTLNQVVRPSETVGRLESGR
jgi:MFS family permease